MHLAGEQRKRIMPQSIPCTIRRLQQADVHAILDIVRDVRLECGFGDRVATVLEPGDYGLFEVYRRRRSAYFVAIYDGKVIGGAGISPLAGGDWLTCELQRMYVRPGHRGSGIGQMLLDACIRAAQSLGFVRCYAETLSEMTAAIGFYEHNGFVRLDAPTGSTGHAHNDCWLMLHISAPAHGGHC